MQKDLHHVHRVFYRRLEPTRSVVGDSYGMLHLCLETGLDVLEIRVRFLAQRMMPHCPTATDLSISKTAFNSADK